MRFNRLRDFANEARRDVGDFRREFILSSNHMRRKDYAVERLNWNSIRFGDEDAIETVPDDKRGVYALTICHPSKVLPSHGYVLYIGIAGRRSKRPLRARYKDYLNEKRVLKRPALAYAIGTWEEVLRFYFAPVDDKFPSKDLERLERQLNTALLPPYSINDLEADTKRKMRAFR